jgi:hypothetical protein
VFASVAVAATRGAAVEGGSSSAQQQQQQQLQVQQPMSTILSTISSMGVVTS